MYPHGDREGDRREGDPATAGVEDRLIAGRAPSSLSGSSEVYRGHSGHGDAEENSFGILRGRPARWTRPPLKVSNLSGSHWAVGKSYDVTSFKPSLSTAEPLGDVSVCGR